GYPHHAGGKAIEGIGLVIGARHQAREGELHALRAVALEYEAVERIEGEKVLVEYPRRPNVGKDPALRSIWINVVKMLEFRRIFEIAKSGDAVLLDVLRCFDIPGERRSERSRAEEEGFAARLLEKMGH